MNEAHREGEDAGERQLAPVESLDGGAGASPIGRATRCAGWEATHVIVPYGEDAPGQWSLPLLGAGDAFVGASGLGAGVAWFAKLGRTAGRTGEG